MNLLTETLPERVVIGGRAWKINTDYRVGIRFELLMQDGSLSDEERLTRALSLYFPILPDDLTEAAHAVIRFYSCGRAERSSGRAERKRERAYCFQQDAEVILAAFRQVYGLDLSEETMHWWKFRALFCALPESCEFCRIVGYRTADTHGMSKKKKEFYERMKRRYALREKTDAAAAMTLAERNRRMKEYVAMRFAEVEGKVR